MRLKMFTNIEKLIDIRDSQKASNNCNNSDHKRKELESNACGNYSNDHEENVIRVILECLKQSRIAFVKFGEKCLCSAVCDENVKEVNVKQLQSHLKKYGIDSQPWPKDKAILLKICNQLMLLENKIYSQILTKYSGVGSYYAMAYQADEGRIKKILIERLINDYQKFGITGKIKDECNGYSCDHLDRTVNIDSVIDSQYLLPDDKDLAS